MLDWVQGLQTFTKILIIVHNEPEIKITTQLVDGPNTKSLVAVFFTDERGELNSTFDPNQTGRSKTKWSGKKLEVRSVDELLVASPRGNRVIRLTTKQKWELSKDGEALTITTSVTGPPDVQLINTMGPGPSVEVFARVN